MAFSWPLINSRNKSSYCIPDGIPTAEENSLFLRKTLQGPYAWRTYSLVYWDCSLFNEAWKNSVNVGVSSSASVLSNLVGMWSGPVSLCSLSVHSNL